MVSEQDILETLRAQAVEVLDVDPATVTREARLGETLEADSIDLIEIAGALEQRYGVELEDHEIYDLETVGQFVDLVARKLAPGS